MSTSLGLWSIFLTGERQHVAEDFLNFLHADECFVVNTSEQCCPFQALTLPSRDEKNLIYCMQCLTSGPHDTKNIFENYRTYREYTFRLKKLYANDYIGRSLQRILTNTLFALLHAKFNDADYLPSLFPLWFASVSMSCVFSKDSSFFNLLHSQHTYILLTILRKGAPIQF